MWQSLHCIEFQTLQDFWLPLEKILCTTRRKSQIFRTENRKRNPSFRSPCAFFPPRMLTASMVDTKLFRQHEESTFSNIYKKSIGSYHLAYTKNPAIKIIGWIAVRMLQQFQIWVFNTENPIFITIFLKLIRTLSISKESDKKEEIH